jgi:hypothetical protein
VSVIIVVGRELNLIGEAVSASQGVVGQAELPLRPLLRTGGQAPVADLHYHVMEARALRLYVSYLF